MTFALPRFLFAQQPAPSPDELYDIIEVLPEASRLPLVIYSVLVLFFLIGLGLAIRYFLRARHTAPAQELPAARAQRQLRELELNGTELEPNRYALAVSETVKDYLAATFTDPVRYETTQEFLGRLSEQGTSLPPAAQQELRDFLIAAEEVKFGHAPGSEKRTTPLLQKAKNLLTLCTAINSESRPRQARRG